MNKVSTFNHILFRIAGGSFIANNEQNLRTGTLLNELILAETNKETLRDKSCDELSLDIKEQYESNPQTAKTLINFKRDLYNNRKITEERVNSIIAISPDLAALLQEYLATEEKLGDILQELETLNQSIEQNELDLIADYCKGEILNCGLLLSSELLYKEAISFDAHKSDNATILGLWKYISRTFAKATPFSTFTQLNVATVTPGTKPVIKVIERSDKLRSEIRYNNYILDLLLVLIKNHPLLFNNFNIKLNSTIKEEGPFYHFFTNNNNVEAFQNIKSNGIIEHFIECVRSNEEITIGQLVTDTLEVLDSSYTSAQVGQYIFQLIQTGLLHINLALSGLDDEWDKSLRMFFEKYMKTAGIGQRAIDTLEQLEQRRSSYASKGHVEREKILLEIRELFIKLFSLLEEDNDSLLKQGDDILKTYNFIKKEEGVNNLFLHRAPTELKNFNFKNLVYEDVTKDIEIEIDQSSVEKIVDSIYNFQLAFSPLCNFIKYDRYTYYKFYSENFADKEQVNLLDFYEKYYRENAQSAQSHFHSTIPLDSVKEFISAQHSAGHISYADGVCRAGNSFLDNFRSHFKDQYSSAFIAQNGVFIQLYVKANNDGEEELHSVISGGMMPGKGKMISRFLYLFDNAVTDDILRWNVSDMPDDELYVENNDASFFNANLHPSLLPYEIDMPGANNRSIGNGIKIGDMIVKPNAAERELELYLPSGKRVLVFDLGFQSLMSRSNLYRLLCTFGNNYGYNYFAVNGLFNNLFTSTVKDNMGNDISIQPRLVFNDIVTFQRKQWHMPSKVLTQLLKENNAQGSGRYIALQKWRKSLGIPDDVFMRVNYTGNNNKNVNRDDYKPQHINFLSSISIKLLLRIISKVEEANVVMEEMLPGRDQLMKIGNKEYAQETLIQWQQAK